MSTALHNLSDYNLDSVPDASNMCFGIIVSEWNSEITGALLDGAVRTLEKHGAIPENIHVKTVPGSFELVYGAHQMTLNGGIAEFRIFIVRPFKSGRTGILSVLIFPIPFYASALRIFSHIRSVIP